MALDIIIPACVTSPSYSLLRYCYDDYLGGNNKPCPVHGIVNQCAGRLSVALSRCGVDFAGFPQQASVHRRCRRNGLLVPDHVMGAAALERYLRTRLALTQEFRIRSRADATAAFNAVRGRTGILYFNDIFVRDNGTMGDHIDLFDGTQCGNDWLNVTPGGRTSSRTRSFFNRANRISFFKIS